MTAREPSAEDVVERQHSGMSSNGNTSPSAVEVLAGAISRRDTGLPLDARSGLDRAALLDISDAALAALKAAGFVVATREQIRAMSPVEQAELIGGEVDHLAKRSGGRIEWACGPWREVQP